MASEQVIPLDELLDPISEDSPVGIDIREDISTGSSYNTIKDARSAARAAERNNMFDSSNSEADEEWRKVIEQAPEILRNQAKDLEIASWYLEALVRRYGFQGLRDGFQLIYGLLQHYWDDLYPLPDEDGIETRVASLTGLNGEGAEGVLIAPIRNVNITQGTDPGPFNYWKYQQALDVEKTIDEDAKSEKAAKLGFNNAAVERAVADSEDTFFIDLVDDLGAAISAYRDAGNLLDDYCGIENSPPISNIINTLGDCLGAVRHIGRHRLPAVASKSDDSAHGEVPNGSERVSNLITSRDDAFKKLLEISVFFRKTEPHSPISYILERAVKWGDLPLEDLIIELIPDSNARDFFGSLTGIRTKDD
jgi:type VI secretion system protein ImpA